MKALIDPRQDNRICQVEENDFPVAEPLYWETCPEDCTTLWTYTGTEFLPPTPYVPTAEENKTTAVSLLQQTDWTTIADVADPQLSNPYLANQAEFMSWRSQVRAIAVSPVAGNLDIFNQMPQESWMYA